MKATEVNIEKFVEFVENTFQDNYNIHIETKITKSQDKNYFHMIITSVTPYEDMIKLCLKLSKYDPLDWDKSFQKLAEFLLQSSILELENNQIFIRCLIDY